LLRIYLVRHGETIWNRDGRLQGQTDMPLNEVGRQQADRLADRLSTEPVIAVWTSDLARARETAVIVAQRHGLEPHASALLRERFAGDWEGLTREEISARGEAPTLTANHQDTVYQGPPNAEPMEAVWDRLVAALAEMRGAYSEGTICVVGHGGSLRVLLCEVIGADIAAMRRIWLDNASLSLIEYDDAGRQWVRLVNDTSHLR
jgi:broad specificity phosphatase PhoE